MYPDDPKGIKSWLEPVVCLKAHSLSPRASKSLSVYAVPNCLARKRTDAILVRNANWESGKDKSLCQKGSPNLPTITTIYTKVMGEKIALVHQLLLKVDQTLTNFSYPVEGLDLSGSSGFKPLPENAVIVSQGADYEFSRTSRFCYMELHWTPSQHHLEDFDQAWLALFDSLLKITVYEVGNQAPFRHLIVFFHCSADVPRLRSAFLPSRPCLFFLSILSPPPHSPHLRLGEGGGGERMLLCGCVLDPGGRCWRLPSRRLASCAARAVRPDNRLSV